MKKADERINHKLERKIQRAREARSKIISEKLSKGLIVLVDKSKIQSAEYLPEIPDYYEDKPFSCRDCGKPQVWTATQQKRWYEIAGGNIETKASRCRICRSAERNRKAAVRRAHIEGLKKKTENSFKFDVRH